MFPGDTDDETSFSGSLSDEDESVEDTLARQQRWDDLVARLVERAESASEPSDRVQSLLRAALVYEAKLDDLDKSFLILQAAFQEDFTNEEVAHELARVTTAAGKWTVLVADCEALMPQLRDDRKRVELLLAMAHFYEVYLHDLVAAEQILGGAVALDPTDITALRGLATLAAGRGDWSRAVEHLANAAEGSRNTKEKVRLHLETASIFETQLADFTRASRQYQRVLALNPRNAIATEALARIAPELDKAIDLVFTPAPLPILEEFGTDDPVMDQATPRPQLERATPVAPRPSIDPAEAAIAASRAAQARGDDAGAVEALGLALQGQPEHRGLRVAMMELATALGDHGAAAQHRKTVLGLIGGEAERFAFLSETAQKLRDGNDAANALVVLNEALDLRPDNHSTLHDALELQSKSKQWKPAVQTLGKLASLETGQARARYLVATGNILNYELHALDEAVDLYNQALDEDPEDLKTFERIEKILSAKRAWRDEARNFRRMIKRLGPNPPASKRKLSLMLWKGLGEICRTRLKDYAAAAAAFEVCASLDPADLTYPEILAEIFELQGPGSVAQALEKRAALVEKARNRDEVVRHVRAMLNLHLEGKQYDRIWCACAALVACGAAEPQEREWYDRLAPRAMVRPRGALSEEMWQRAVYHPREDRRLSRLFAAVSPTMVLLRARDGRGFGLDERRRLPEHDGSLLSQLVSYVSQLLAVARPAIAVEPKHTGLELLNVVEQGLLAPTLVVGGDLLQPRSEREVAFLVGRALAMLRFEHMVLWPQVIGSAAELRGLAFAVVKFFQPAFEPPLVDHAPTRQCLALLQKNLPPHAHEPLMQALPPVMAEPAALDATAWAAGAQLTANRAGLVACGDLLTATRVVGEDPGGKGVGAEEAVADLIRWNVSPEHLAIREQLGLMVEAPLAVAAPRTTGTRGL